MLLLFFWRIPRPPQKIESICSSPGRLVGARYCWRQPEIWARKPVQRPMIYKVLAPSKVVVWDFWTISMILLAIPVPLFFFVANQWNFVWNSEGECVAQDRPVTSCLVQNLVSNANYTVRLREAWFNRHGYEDLKDAGPSGVHHVIDPFDDRVFLLKSIGCTLKDSLLEKGLYVVHLFNFLTSRGISMAA